MTAFSLRNILLATDLTAFSDRAFDRALLLAEEQKAKLRVLHVIDSNLLPAELVQESIAEAKAILERDVRECVSGQLVEASVKAATGAADTVVVEEASKMPADLIVMGLAQHGTVSAMVRGTTIDRVVRASACPVLAVKRRARRAYGSILVSVDGGEPSRHALTVALRAFPGAKISIVHADESGQLGARHQVEDMVRVKCQELGVAGQGGPQLIVKSGRAVGVLQRVIAESNPDLVIFGTHGRKGVARAFLGSVAETLLEVLTADALVVRA
ncbi:MAG: universal stress protein [Alphaproteobacteria bacterium]|nr:universal stress protein [Alphaproteobacteria bacterium]